MDPNSPGGSTISKQEKDKIYKAIKEVEDKIAIAGGTTLIPLSLG
jgi:hypothetical protein